MSCIPSIQVSPTHALSPETLYKDHNHWLRGWLRRKLGCSETAADLAQDTFVRLLTHPQLIANLLKPRAFLTTVARGLVIDFYRSRSLEQAYLEALASLPENFVVSPEEREILLQTLQQIDALLDQLPHQVRTAFLLSQIHGLTYADIARQMNVSERTIKRYMQQGFAQCIAALL